MALTHGIALLFAVIFIIMAVVFNKMLWWLLNIGYLIVLALMAIINEWEALFFVPLIFFGLISLIGMIITATRGDII